MFLSRSELEEAFPILFLYETKTARLKYSKIESLTSTFRNLEKNRSESIATFLEKGSDDTIDKTVLIYTWNNSTDLFELESYRDKRISVSKLDDPLSFDVHIPLSESVKTIRTTLFVNGETLIYDIVNDELIIYVIRY